jgi:diacylglycerol O-acyltransferase / wax synthase
VSGAPERLSLDDARILGLESAAITGHTCKVAIIEPPAGGRAIGIEELRRHVSARLGRVRRCRQRVALLPMGLARPVWVDYPDFDIAEHVCRYEVDGEVDRPRLLRIAAELMAERLDHTRPLWQMHLVGPLEGGGSAIVWRIHHCMADGVASARLGGQILWESEPDAESPEPEPWRPEPEPSPLRLLASGLRERAGDAARSVEELARDATSPGRWVSTARAAGRLPGSLIRELTPSCAGSRGRWGSGSARM